MIDRTQLPHRGALLSAMPLFHTAGCAMGVLGSAHQRAAYVLCQLFDPTLVLTAARQHRANLLAGVPTMLIAMLNHPDFAEFYLTELSCVLSGGSPIPPELVRQVENGAEIEQVLFTHPGVREATVLGLPDPTWGEIVVAVVVSTHPDRPPAAAAAPHDHCRTHLAPHKTPARWFHATDLPLTGSGKIQKFRLREQLDRAELPELP